MTKLRLLQILLFSTFLLYTSNSNAEVITDASLGVESSVVNTSGTPSGTFSSITGGALRGNNLFHSLQNLNVYKGDEVDILNPNNANRIFVRVTGGSSSLIDGIFKSVSNANIYLINQKGLSIHNNAVFDIGGALVVTTASKIGFDDRNIFSAMEGNHDSILSLGKPDILSFDGTSSAIFLTGNGAGIVQNTEIPIFPITKELNLSGSIFTRSNHEVYIAGNGIYLDGGIISNDTGSLNILSIQKGNLVFDINNNNIVALTKDNIFADISLDNQSLLYTKGNGTGSINLLGNTITLNNRSVIATGNYGFLKGGDVVIYASGNFNINGIKNTFERSTVISENISTTSGSNIYIYANNLNLTNSVGVSSSNYYLGKGGSIYINVINSINEFSNQPTAQGVISPFISSLNFGEGQGGNIHIKAENTNLNNGSIISNFCFGKGNCGDLFIDSDNINLTFGVAISSNTFGPGNSGTVKIDANSINIKGFRAFDLYPSLINTSSFSSGNSGDLFVNTDILNIIDGGVISGAALSSGNSGNVNITANESLTISGQPKGSINSSQISASSTFLDPALAAYYNLTSPPSGDSGNITIRTSNLKITDGGKISVQSDGFGKGGTALIYANRMFLDNGYINAITKQTDGGNLVVSASAIMLKNNSSISATAGSNGNGGNVTLNTGAFAADHSSSILAQAIRGQGGNISINAGGIVGNPHISASSELGVDGTVQVRGDELKRQNNFKDSPKPTISNLNTKCVPGSEGRRLIGVTRDYINDEVLDNLAARPEQLKFVDDMDGGKIKPLIRERGYVKTSDGKIEFVYAIPADAVISSKQNLSACTLLEQSVNR